MVRVSIGIAVALAAGCVNKDSRKHEARTIDPAWVQAHLLAAEPAMAHRLDVPFGGGKLIYLGNDVSPEEIEPGGSVTIHHYWKVVEPPGAEWRIFSHLAGDRPQDWTNVDDSDLRQGHPCSAWQAGEILDDEHKFTIDKDWQSPYVDVLVGLYPKGKNGITDRMEVSGPAVDDQRRLRVARIEVAQGAVPWNYVIRRATGPITIDGAATEPDWKAARESPDFTPAEGGPSPRGRTTARMLWDDQFLYVFVHSEDPDVASQYTVDDSDTWREDVVEVFVDADRNGTGYVELQVNPHNAHFDAWFPQTRQQKSHVEWNAGLNTAVVVDGTLDQRGDTDKGWDAEIAIPLAAVKGMDDAMVVTLPPQVGDMWRLNVVRSDKPENGAMIAASWNPLTYKDFHAPDRMLTVAFGDTDGRAPVPAEPEQPRARGPRPPHLPTAPESVESSGGVPSATESAGVPDPESAGVPQGSSNEESSGGVPEQPSHPMEIRRRTPVAP